MSAPAISVPPPPDRHGGPGRALRAVTFIVGMYGLLFFMGLACAIPSWASKRWALFFIKSYCRIVLGVLRVIVGTRVEIRGQVPDQPCIVAAKHQAFLDILILTLTLPRPCFVMKKSIRWVPVLNIYAERLGNIPIDRSAGRSAMAAILDGAEKGRGEGRQLIIFPQGTRVRPGVQAPYKPGVLRLYQQMGQPIVTAALNTGWFWPRTGTRRTPGTAILDFTGQIAPGQPTRGLMTVLTEQIEQGSDRLAAEAAAELAGDPAMAHRD